MADAISQLDYGPAKDVNWNWMTFTKCWNFYPQEVPLAEAPKYKDSMYFVFASTQEEESIYPLTLIEIVAESQIEDTDLKKLAKADKYEKS